MSQAGKRRGMVPVYLHSNWRSSSTYVWAKFRALPQCCCLFEPLAEHLRTATPAIIEGFRPWAFAHHPALDAPYQHEFLPLLRPGGGVESFPAESVYHPYRLDGGEPVPALAAYFAHLTGFARQRDQMPVFGLVRSGLRVPWFRRHCPGTHIAVQRNHRRQFLSYLHQSIRGNRYFLERLMVILGSNPDDPALAPLRHLVEFPPPEFPAPLREAFLARQAHTAEPMVLYTIFYFLHRLAMITMAGQCDLVLDVDHLAGDPDSVGPDSVCDIERRVAQLTGLEISFADCRPEFYTADLALSTGFLAETEAEVEAMLATLPPGLPGAAEPAPPAALSPPIGPDLAARLERAQRRALRFQTTGMESRAERLYGRILRIDSAHFASLTGLGLLREEQGRIDEAEDLIRQAVARQPRMVPLLVRHAHLLTRRQSFAEAATRLRQAAALEPGDSAIRNDLGMALHRLGQLAEAVFQFRAVLDLSPDYADAHNNLGTTLRQLNQHDEAVFHLRRATELNPASSAAWGNLAKVMMELGRVDEVVEALERVIAIVPDKALYYRSLSEAWRFTPGDRHLTALETIARDGEALPPESRVEIHFALAKALDDIGDVERSFDHLLLGNRLKRASISYDEAFLLDQFERVRAAFTPELMQRLAGLGHGSAEPVFILGMPRSGSTLVEQILASHPAVTAAGELDGFAQTVTAVLGPHFPAGMAGVAAADLRQMGAAYLETVHLGPLSDGTGKAVRFTDKMPVNFVFAGLIHLALPRARIIHTRRDPVETCLSCFSKFFVNFQPFTWDLAELGRYWRAYDAMMEHWRRVLPPHVLLEVDHQAVVDDLEGQARRMVAHCGLDWDPACLDFHRAPSPVRTASWAQVRRPIYRKAAERWRVYGDRLAPLLEALAGKV